MIGTFDNKTVLVTGGAQGLGLATALAFASLGASTIVTYHWGSVDETGLQAKFAALGAKAPLIVQADVALPEDTVQLLATVQAHHSHIDIFISTVTGSVVIPNFEAMTERALLKSISYTAWPTFAYLQRMKQVFGRYPHYVVALSSTGVDSYNPGYEFVAASKAVLETLARYANFRLRNEHININVVRASLIDTQSTHDMFGDEVFGFLNAIAPPDFNGPKPEQVASVIIALCSGLLDGVRGEVLTVDQGVGFCDNLMRLYTQRDS